MKCLDRFTLEERVALRRISKKSPMMFIRVWFYIITGKKMPTISARD